MPKSVNAASTLQKFIRRLLGESGTAVGRRRRRIAVAAHVYGRKGQMGRERERSHAVKVGHLGWSIRDKVDNL